MCLPLALAGQDLIGQAKTGTGKTLAFGIPLLQAVSATETAKGRSPQALVVVPTRELCLQVAGDLAETGKRRGAKVISIYGGRAYEPQVEALTAGVDVVVGTPGRLLDLARQRKLNLDQIRVLVLDEADEMLDMGFLPDVESIVALVPQRSQTMLFSATMPGQIVNLARRYLNNPTHIRATDPNSDTAIVDAIEQHVWRAHSLDKLDLVARILQANGRGLTMIFSRTKRTAQKVADELVSRGFAAGSVHGDLGQGAREQALRAFRSGKIDVLVATDVAARGIDVEGVTHVINYMCPEDEKTYVHRVGRTGRAGASGVAVTLVDWDDVPRWQLINKALGLPFTDPIETYSTSAHLYAGLGIPRAAGPSLARRDRTRAGLDAEQVEDLGGREPRPTTKGPARKQASDSSRPAQRTKSRPPGSRKRTRAGDDARPPARPSVAPTASRVEPTESSVTASESSSAKPPRQRRRRRPHARPDQGGTGSAS